MARHREFDSDTVLTALRDVFWEYGYEGTSYADIMDATGLKKGSLYAAFGNKRSLYIEALGHYNKINVSDGVRLLSNEALTGAERIEALMQILVDAAETKRGRWGCLLCNAAVDQAPSNKQTEAVVRESMQRMKMGIAQALNGTRAEDKVELIWALYFGGRVIVKSGENKAGLIKLKEQVSSLL